MELRFGKHRGTEISDVPTEYLKWMLENIEPKSGNFDNTELLKETQLELDAREKHGEIEGDAHKQTDGFGFQEPPAF